MPVVFDEIVGTVDSPAPATSEEHRAQPTEKADDRQIRSTLRHLERREARLHAD